MESFFIEIAVHDARLKLELKEKRQMVRVRISEMSWVDVQKALDRGFRTVVFGVGSNEQHGPHLPTCTDSLIGDDLANRVARKLGKALQAPTINVGCSEHHMAFPGTLDIKTETLKSLIRDYCFSLEKNGFKNIIILPWHGGNFEPVQDATEELNQCLKEARVISYTDLLGLLRFFADSSLKHGVSAPESGAHAGESETSIALTIRKDLVHMEHAEQGFVGNYEEKIPIIWSQGIKAVARNGVIGDPRKAEAGKGEEYLELWAGKMVDFIRKHIDM